MGCTGGVDSTTDPSRADEASSLVRECQMVDVTLVRRNARQRADEAPSPDRACQKVDVTPSRRSIRQRADEAPVPTFQVVDAESM